MNNKYIKFKYRLVFGNPPVLKINFSQPFNSPLHDLKRSPNQKAKISMTCARLQE